MKLSTWQIFLALTALLSSLGLLFVFEASVAEAFTMVGDPYFFLKQQLVRWGIGVLVGSVAYFTPWSWWQKTAPWWYGISIVLLILVFVPGIGRELNGAHRWLVLGGQVLQPIEVMKLSLIVFFSSWMIHHQRLLPFLFLTAVPSILTILQPDLGSLLVVLTICFGMYFLAGGKLLHLSLIGLAGIVLISGAIFSSEYRMRRITTFINPESDPLGASFHIRQITLALGNGGWWGQGLGNSRQKYSYIPEASTDSIFAIVAEEVGMVGSLFIILLYAAWLYCLYTLVSRVHNHHFAYLFGSGIFIWLSSQVILNLAAVVALVPLTGVPLPLFSYGGSSLVMVLLASGLILKVGHTT